MLNVKCVTTDDERLSYTLSKYLVHIGVVDVKVKAIVWHANTSTKHDDFLFPILRYVSRCRTSHAKRKTSGANDAFKYTARRAESKKFSIKQP